MNAGRARASGAVPAASVTSSPRRDVAPLGTATGKAGVWENVTPPGSAWISKTPGNGDNYGVLDILADPARPTDLYAFICYQGVWRSTDLAAPKQVNPGSNWGSRGAPRSIPTPSAIRTRLPPLRRLEQRHRFSQVVDFGVTWTEQRMPDAFGRLRYQQVYSIDVDPYDMNHVIIAFHEAPDVGESTDGGKTWKKIPTPPEDGGSSVTRSSS